MDAPRIDQWRTFHGGFRQHGGDVNGITELELQTHDILAGSRTKVEFHAWSDDVADLAERIRRCSNGRGSNGRGPDVRCCGYSWGGAAAVRLCHELKARGVRVETLVLIDAVYRDPYWGGNWRSLVPWSKLRIPVNVREVYWFRQVNPVWSRLFSRTPQLPSPKGHDVVREEFAGLESAHWWPEAKEGDVFPRIHDAIVVGAEHNWIDDNADVKDLALDLMTR